MFQAESQYTNPEKKDSTSSIARAASEPYSRKTLKENAPPATWSQPDQSKPVSKHRENIIKMERT